MSTMVPDILHYSVMRLPGVDTTTIKLNPDIRQVNGGDTVHFDLPFSGELNLREMYVVGDLYAKSGGDPSGASIGSNTTPSLRLPEDNMACLRQVRVEAGGELIDGSTMQDAGYVQAIRDNFRMYEDERIEDSITKDGFKPDSLGAKNLEERPRAVFKDFPGIFSHDTVPEVIDMSLLPKMRLSLQLHNAQDVLLPVDSDNGQYYPTIDNLSGNDVELTNIQLIATFYNTKDSAIANLTQQTLSAGSPIEILFDRYVSRDFGTGAHKANGISRFDITSESIDYILATYRPGRIPQATRIRNGVHNEQIIHPFTDKTLYKSVSGIRRMTAAPEKECHANDASASTKTHTRDLSDSKLQTITNWQFRLNGSHVPQYDADVRDSWQFLQTQKDVHMNFLSMADYLRNGWCAFQRFNLPNTNKRVQSGLNAKGLRLGVEYESKKYTTDQSKEDLYSLFMLAKCSSTLVIGPNSQVFVRI